MLQLVILIHGFSIVVYLLLSIILILSEILEIFCPSHLLCLHFQFIWNVLNIVDSGNNLVADHVLPTWP